MSSVQPVFIKNRDIPNSVDNRVTGLELCIAAERSSGHGSVVGAQNIRGLWRIYPATVQARNDLLIKGMTVRNTTVQLANTNPFILRESSGEEKPATKVWVADIPISVANSEIEHSLVSVGCELRSDIKQERYRDADNKLTRFETGRRFVFITTPATPLEKNLKVGPFTATVFHKEQKNVRKTVVCSKCLQPNHHASVCINDVVCLTCKQPGHKRGDACCEAIQAAVVKDPPNEDAQKRSAENAQSKRHSQPVHKMSSVTPAMHESRAGGRSGGKAGKGNESKTGNGNKNNASPESERRKSKSERVERGRLPVKKQTTLHSSMAPRSDRSETPKRGRSRDRDSPIAAAEKQPRYDLDDDNNDNDDEMSDAAYDYEK